MLGEFPKSSKYETFSKDILISRLEFFEQECVHAFREIYRLKNQNLTDTQIALLLQEQLAAAQKALYSSSSERYKKKNSEKEIPSTAKPEKPRTKRPSERYPNVPVREQTVAMDPIPDCTSCGKGMVDSGMSETSEQLTVIPKKFEIILQKRVKYRCSCHACITTAPVPERIIEGSSYSDEMILDVAMSKYCDLIPIHRYVAMADRSGVRGIPSQSLIELTHGLADFVKPAYALIKENTKKARVLNADETPHKMLEGSDTKNWYLWGFSTPELCFLECHNTRSGDVASEMLLDSKCEILVSDVYAGYGKAMRIANISRAAKEMPLIQNANCNAHARRYFFQTVSTLFPDGEYYLEQYQKIYKMNELSKGKPPPEILEIRAQMVPCFELMKKRAEQELTSYSEQGKYGKALRYFLTNYQGLTLFLKDPEVPIDNNSQERLLRSHVVGRKTWYGTHSERGAETASILFSLTETCKLNGVNPREYFAKLTADMLEGKIPFTPAEFKKLP